MGDDGSGSGGTSGLRLLTVRDLDGVRRLGAAWDALHARCETRSPFLCHPWAVSWLEVLGEELEPWVLLVEDDDGPVALAPLARARRRAGPLPCRVLEIIGTSPLRFLGMGLADRADLLVARRHREAVELVARTLLERRREWDLLDLRFVPEGSSTLAALRAVAPGLGLSVVTEPCSRSPYLTLHGTWDEYLAGRGRAFRKDLRRKRKRLSEAGEHRFDLAAERSGDVSEIVERVIEVSLSSWKEERGSALFQHERVRRFVRAVAPRLAERGLLYVAVLEIDERIAAHELGFRMDGTLWSWDSAFRREHARCSPGLLLTAALLEQAWAEGLSEYDLLRGDADYKLAWSRAIRRELQVVVGHRRWRSRAARRLGFELKWLLKRHPVLVEAQSRFVGALNKLIEPRRG